MQLAVTVGHCHSLTSSLSLAMFSLPALLLKLVSGMGLLTLTATIVDTLALYLLPNRLVYRRKVFEETDEIKTFKFKKG